MLKKIIRPGEPGYQQCTVTIMDTTDPDISFDQDGVSNWVYYYKEKILPNWKPEGDEEAFASLINRIKQDGKGKEYDCALGLSGGVDSSYLAYLAKREGLRTLVVHVDTGWNSDVAVTNIERIVKSCGFDLFTLVIDWDEMADLQRAYLRSGVPDLDVPQDHVIYAALYKFITKHKFKWVLSGHNNACESILPVAWSHSARDLKQLMSIHHKFGERPLENFPRMSNLRFGIFYTLLRGMRVAKLLDFVKYDKAEAIAILEREFDWQDYGGKHFESRWTRFFQGWWLPVKFGYDKRLAHLSSLILSGQITREAALLEIMETSYTQNMMETDRDLILKKLRMPFEEWEAILASRLHDYNEYQNSDKLDKVLIRIGKILKNIGLVN